GGDPDFITEVRGQGNYIEYVPLTLILITFTEARVTSASWIHVVGTAFVVGRMTHLFGLTKKPGVDPLRFVGTNLTWPTLLAASVLVLVNQYGIGPESDR
ncbi:MAG: MAPEG family protein, partial [Gammaproteobacteria bacterium]